jgi:hypothetical protein
MEGMEVKHINIIIISAVEISALGFVFGKFQMTISSAILTDYFLVLHPVARNITITQ